MLSQKSLCFMLKSGFKGQVTSRFNLGLPATYKLIELSMDTGMRNFIWTMYRKWYVEIVIF